MRMELNGKREWIMYTYKMTKQKGSKLKKSGRLSALFVDLKVIFDSIVIEKLCEGLRKWGE